MRGKCRRLTAPTYVAFIRDDIRGETNCFETIHMQAALFKSQYMLIVPTITNQVTLPCMETQEALMWKKNMKRFIDRYKLMLFIINNIFHAASGRRIVCFFTHDNIRNTEDTGP